MMELPILKIASPCSVKWEQMTGDERVRRCAECDRDVFDFSAMDADALAQLLAERSGLRTCARLFQRPDGRILTKDCPQERKVRVRYVSRIAGAALGTAISLSVALAQTPASSSPPISQVKASATGIAALVRDPNGEKVSGATVSVLTLDQVEVRNGESDASGKAEILDLLPGHYLVRIRAYEGTLFGEARVLIKKGKITSFEEKLFVLGIGEYVEVKTREIKPKR